MPGLSRLTSVDVREYWKNEASDFTPWLAEEENISLLGETIGIELEVQSTEEYVGTFKADILCKDTATDQWVLIENQLEKTDHAHLGQLMTYSSGLGASIIIWIARRFSEEHRAALDWLNEITDGRFNFFGVEMELWRIGESPAAPKFNLVCKPNEWTKTISGGGGGLRKLTDVQQMQLEYWADFRSYVEESGSFLKPTKPQPQHWMTFAVGRSGFRLTAQARTVFNKGIAAALIIFGPDAKAHFNLLRMAKESIEQEISSALDWRDKPNNKQSYISLNRTDVDPADRDEWPKQHEWLRTKLEAFHKAFSERIRELDASNYVSDEEGK